MKENPPPSLLPQQPRRIQRLESSQAAKCPEPIQPGHPVQCPEQFFGAWYYPAVYAAVAAFPGITPEELAELLQPPVPVERVKEGWEVLRQLGHLDVLAGERFPMVFAGEVSESVLGTAAENSQPVCSNIAGTQALKSRAENSTSTNLNVAKSDDAGVAVLRQHSRQMMALARVAMNSCGQNRHVGRECHTVDVSFAVGPQGEQLLRSRLELFRENARRIAMEDQREERIYQLNIQLFPVGVRP